MGHEEASGTRAVRAPEGGPGSDRFGRNGGYGLQDPKRERRPDPRLPAHGLPVHGQLDRVASSPEARVPEVSFLEFRDRAGLDGRRIPIEGTIETTYRCNLDCVHCYVNEPAGSREERERELSLERLKELVDEIVAEGTLFVLFTGGEVLVRPDFPDLYLYARSKGLLVTIFTNGTMITDADRRPVRRAPARQDRDQPLRDDEGDLRPGHPRPRLLREVPRRDPPPGRAGSAPHPEDDGAHLEPPRDRGDGGLREEPRPRLPLRQLAQPAGRLRRQPQLRAAARPGARARARPRQPRAHGGLPRVLRALHAAGRRVRGGEGLHLRRRPELVHRRPLRAAADVPALAEELPRPQGRELRRGLARAVSRGCARGPGRRTRSAASAA